MFGIRQIVAMLYPLLESYVSALRVVLPYDAVVAIVDAVEVGVKHELKAGIRFNDTDAWFMMVKELGDAAVLRTPKERREAVYSLLVFCTDIEESLSLEEFMTYASQVSLPDDVV